MRVKFVEGDIDNPLAIHEIFASSRHKDLLTKPPPDPTSTVSARLLHTVLWHLPFFIDAIAHMHDLETVVISARTRRIDTNKVPFFAFCGIENVLTVG